MTQKENGWYHINDRVECVLGTKEDWKIERYDNYNLESLTKYFEYLKKVQEKKTKLNMRLLKKN